MADESLASALSAAAPAQERYDAQVEFARGEGTLQQALQLSEDIAPVIGQIRDILEEQDLAKSARGNLIVGPWKDKRATTGGQSVFLDDFQIVTQGNYWDRPGLLGFDSMRAMIDQTPILNSIILTRIRQVSRFCRPQLNATDTGFTIGHIDRKVELNDEQQKSVQLLQGFMTNCGWETDPRRRKRLKRDSLTQFMAKSVRDTLTMDSAPIETEFKRARDLGLDGFYAVDGATIRLCSEQGYEGDDEVFALQVIQGNIRTAYTYDDLVYEVRNPRTDVTACGYGYSEAEMLVRIVTYLLNTMTYNGSFFDKNAIPRGMLNLVGNYSPEDLAAFKRYWNAMCRGTGNVHNMPIMVAKDGESKSEFVEIGGQLSEMAFGKWMTFLTSIACAVYGAAPEDISMESYSEGKSSLSGSDTAEKLVSSNDKGLRPLLGYYEGVFSDFILQPFSPEYSFRFVGLDGDDSQKRFERSKLTLTWNEARGIDGYDPIPGPLGDMPLNQTFIAPWQAVTGIGQPEPEDDFGDPDAEGDDDAGGGEPPAASGPVGDKPPAGGDADKAPDFGAPPAAGLAKAMDFGLPIFKIED